MRHSPRNVLEREHRDHGTSGGFVTRTFDLTPYRGSTVWLAFVFGSDDRRQNDGEGWWIDRVTIEIEEPGAEVCDVIRWPGSIPSGSLLVEKAAGSDLRASWGASCNLAAVPGQTYALHSGTLSSLHGSGTYDHAPVNGLCDRLSPSVFTPGAGDEYYLVAPVGDGREGGLGLDSTGSARPQVGSVCGLPRAEACP